MGEGAWDERRGCDGCAQDALAAVLLAIMLRNRGILFGKGGPGRKAAECQVPPSPRWTDARAGRGRGRGESETTLPGMFSSCGGLRFLGIDATRQAARPRPPARPSARASADIASCARCAAPRRPSGRARWVRSLVAARAARSCVRYCIDLAAVTSSRPRGLPAFSAACALCEGLRARDDLEGVRAVPHRQEGHSLDSANWAKLMPSFAVGSIHRGRAP